MIVAVTERGDYRAITAVSQQQNSCVTEFALRSPRRSICSASPCRWSRSSGLEAALTSIVVCKSCATGTLRSARD